jgi:integrase
MATAPTAIRQTEQSNADEEEAPPPFPGATLGRPEEPWVPARMVIHPLGKAKTTRRQGKTVKCWDVRGTVDGWPYFKRFTQPDGTAERARGWANRLVEDFNRGWAYDPKDRRFVEPTSPDTAADATPTVVACAVSFLDRKWDTAWEPKTRQAAVRALKRACTHLVLPDAPERPDADVSAYLDAVLTSARSRPRPLPEDAARGEAWLCRWSRPIDQVTWEDLESFLVRFRTNQLRPDKRVSAATERRFTADLKQFWADASARHRFANPWPAVGTLDRAAGRRAARGVQPVDRDVVLSPAQIAWLALASGIYGTWGPQTVCFVLVMGLCGLRPNEAVGLEVGGLELPAEGAGWLTTTRSRRHVASRWLEPDEDPEWGPLKDRDLTESRTAPVPTWLVPLLRTHVALFRSEAGPRDLLFCRSGRPYDLSVFDREVWQPARAALFPPDPHLGADDPRQPRLSRLRRHDLRHAACSLWLNAGVDVKVCQRWSGHKRLSVFLDIYQGILPGREEEGVRALNGTLALHGLSA